MDDEEIRFLRHENARLVREVAAKDRELAHKDREFLQLHGLLITTGDHLLAVAEPLRQTARGIDEVKVQLLTNIPAIMLAVGAVKKQTEREDTAAIKLWDRFAAAPARVQWTVFAIFGALAVSGWAVKIVEWAIGK